MATTETATNRNGHKPERQQTETAINRKGHKPKRPQIETASNRIGHKPERPQTETAKKTKWTQTGTATQDDIPIIYFKAHVDFWAIEYLGK